jgi:hypothetical protein
MRVFLILSFLNDLIYYFNFTDFLIQCSSVVKNSKMTETQTNLSAAIVAVSLL